MTNLKALESKLENLQAKWSEVAFDSGIKAEKRYDILGGIEQEIFLTKEAIKKMKVVLGL